jgi:hypothetical protein
MAKVVPVKGILLVEQYDKLKKHNSSSPFTSVVVSNNLGTVKYSSDDDYPVGTQIYFANQFEKLTVEGQEVLAVKVENVFAKVVEASNG